MIKVIGIIFVVIWKMGMMVVIFPCGVSPIIID